MKYKHWLAGGWPMADSHDGRPGGKVEQKSKSGWNIGNIESWCQYFHTQIHASNRSLQKWKL